MIDQSLLPQCPILFYQLTNRTEQPAANVIGQSFKTAKDRWKVERKHAGTCTLHISIYISRVDRSYEASLFFFFGGGLGGCGFSSKKKKKKMKGYRPAHGISVYFCCLSPKNLCEYLCLLFIFIFY